MPEARFSGFFFLMTMKRLLTVKQEKFVQNLFYGMNQAKAYTEAGYTCTSLASITSNACRLAKNVYVLQYLQTLRDKAEAAKVMSVKERKERLTEIAKARLTDFMELGQDGSWVNLGPEVQGTAAIQEIHSRTEYDDDGAKPTVHTSVKLHDPMKAIDLLNKMDRLYYEENKDKSINVTVVNITAKELTDDQLASIASGSRPRVIEQAASS